MYCSPKHYIDIISCWWDWITLYGRITTTNFTFHPGAVNCFWMCMLFNTWLKYSIWKYRFGIFKYDYSVHFNFILVYWYIYVIILCAAFIWFICQKGKSQCLISVMHMHTHCFESNSQPKLRWTTFSNWQMCTVKLAPVTVHALERSVSVQMFTWGGFYGDKKNANCANNFTHGKFKLISPIYLIY